MSESGSRVLLGNSNDSRNNGAKERGMKAMWSRRGAVAIWGATLAMIPWGYASGATAKSATAQEKKEEKKEEKDEKKALTLKPDRKIEFTTDAGTWLSLDVSPDGKTIAFELLGDIYTLPIEGGLPFDSQPRFSPDGKWIAFISDREGSDNIWVMRADGSDAKQVSKDPNSEFASPSW